MSCPKFPYLLFQPPVYSLYCTSRNQKRNPLPLEIAGLLPCFENQNFPQLQMGGIFKRAKHEVLFLFVHVLVLFTVQGPAFPHPTSMNCVSDFGNSTFLISSSNCCGGAFSWYLYALARQANLTGAMYLNATEQYDCLSSLVGLEDEDSLSGTSGDRGCSDFTVADVANKLGHKFQDLKEDCTTLGSNESCGPCLRRWEEAARSLDDKQNSTAKEAYVCRFAILISVISNRIDDEKWVEAMFQCLGNQSLPIEEKRAPLTSEKAKINTGKFLIIGLMAMTMVVATATCILFKRKKNGSPTIEKEEPKYTISEDSTNAVKISVKEIFSATNNFDQANFIGQGIAGKVYKGRLSNGQQVAVKHIISDGEVETFVREVRSLSHVRHPNLVALIGYCETDGGSFLVYELCLNGNLANWLYGKDKRLSWIQRLEIAVDSARGLWFLHTYPEGCIVHRDIKPANILLDENLHAKLSDFGLSKIMDIGQSQVSSEVRGTFGYVDPEYRKNRRVNASGDVYSFGIVLLQLLSGQKVLNMNTNRPLSLSKKARFLTRGSDIAGFADPKLNGEYPFEAFELVLKLAISCTGLKQERPQMEQVALTLESAIHMSTRAIVNRTE